jgi:hypothetical protein
LAQFEAQARALLEEIETALARLEIEYKEGLIDTTTYYEKRGELIERQFKIERELLEDKLALERDAAGQIKIQSDIKALEAKHERELAQLGADRRQTLKDQSAELGEQGKKADELLKHFERISSRPYGMDPKIWKSAYDADLEALREYLRVRLSSIEEENEAEIELYQKIADAVREVEEVNLRMRGEVAAGLASTFEEAFEMTGSSVKELFYLAKAAAVAEAIVNAHLAATKALAEGGPTMGPVMAGVIYAQAMVHVAAIIAEAFTKTFAGGGLVRGYSPSDTADNIPARLTAGEFVIAAAATRYYGAGLLEALNRRRLPKDIFAGFALALPAGRPGPAFAAGGLVGPRDPGHKGIGSISIINVQDPRQIGSYLSSAQGQRAILNVLGANRSRALRALR